MGLPSADSPVELTRKVADLDARVRDLEQRLDTAQTHGWKRVWFWVRWGWPMTDWNADRPNWRPWNRGRRVG
jgi:hypothetical protein